MAAFDRMSIFRYFVLGLSSRLLASSCFSSLSLSLSFSPAENKFVYFSPNRVEWNLIV